MNRKVTEADFRMPEFRDANPEDYEFRDGDNAIVRKDRWEQGIRKIAGILEFDPWDEVEIEDVVDEVELIKTLVANARPTPPPPPHKEVEDIQPWGKP